MGVMDYIGLLGNRISD